MSMSELGWACLGHFRHLALLSGNPTFLFESSCRDQAPGNEHEHPFGNLPGTVR